MTADDVEVAARSALIRAPLQLEISKIFRRKRSWQVARELFIHSPHRTFSLCSIRGQLFVLLEFHRGDGLIFGRASGNFILDSVSCINKQLPQALQPRS